MLFFIPSSFISSSFISSFYFLFFISLFISSGSSGDLLNALFYFLSGFLCNVAASLLAGQLRERVFIGNGLGALVGQQDGQVNALLILLMHCNGSQDSD